MQLKEHLDKSFFWDTNFAKLDVDKSARWVIQRVIDRGTDLQREKLIEYYQVSFVREVMLKARYIMPFGIHFVFSKVRHSINRA